MVLAVVWEDSFLICSYCCKGCISRFATIYVYVYAIFLCINCVCISFLCLLFCVVEVYCHIISSIDHNYRRSKNLSRYSCCCLVQSLYLCTKDIEGLVTRSRHY